MNQRWRRYFGWSKSSAGLFRECRKRYSFHYIYKYEPGPTAAMAKRLSKLNNLPIAKGSLVHDEIERFLTQRRRTGREDHAEARHRLGHQFDMLAEQAEDRVLEVVLGASTLDEARERLVTDKADALRQWDAFYQEHWPRYRDLEVVCFEELERFKAAGHQVWVSADLVVKRPEGGLLLVDWKTGLREEPADESEQLTGYILWARDRFHTPVDQIEGELVWLSSGNVDRTSRVPEQLQALTERIDIDCQTMLSMDSYDQVEASPSERQCRRCNFLPLCREGAQWMDPEARKRALVWLGTSG